MLLGRIWNMNLYLCLLRESERLEVPTTYIDLHRHLVTQYHMDCQRFQLLEAFFQVSWLKFFIYIVLEAIFQKILRFVIFSIEWAKDDMTRYRIFAITRRF